MNLISMTFSGRDNSIPRAQYEKKRKSNLMLIKGTKDTAIFSSDLFI